MSQQSVLVIGESAKDRAAVRHLLSRSESDTYRIGEARSCVAALRRLKRETWSCVALCEPLGEGSAELRRFLKDENITLLSVGVTERSSADDAISIVDRSKDPGRNRHELNEALNRAMVLESLHDAVLVTETVTLRNPDPRVVYVNPAFERITGYSSAEVVGQSPRILLGEFTDREKLDRIRAALERAEPIQLELTNYRKDGTPFDIEVHLLPLTDEAGKTIQCVSIQRDVTEEKRILRVLREERDRFEKMVCTSPALFCSLRQRTDGLVHVPFVGAGCRELLGFEPEELLEDASPLFARILPEDLPRVQTAMACSAKALTEIKIKYGLRHPERGTVWIEVHSMPMAEPDGSILWHGTATDVTEQRRIRKELEHREAQLFGIIHSAMDAIITIDESQRIVVFNAAAERMFRTSAMEALGETLHRFLPERFRKAHGSHVRGFGQSGISSRFMESNERLFGLRASGEEFPLEASISLSEVEGSKLYSVTLRDITERKHAEAMVQRQVEALTKPLSALKSLPELDPFLERLLGALTHWMQAASAALWLCEPDQKYLSLVGKYEAKRFQTGFFPNNPTEDQRFPQDDIPFWTILCMSRKYILLDQETLSAPPYRDWSLAQGIVNLLVVPLLLGDETIGFLSIRNVATHLQKPEMEMVQGLAQQAALAVELKRLAEQEQTAAILQERNRFAQDIHDTLAQGFTGILLQLEAAEYAPEQSQARVHIQQARELARQSLLEARRSVQALRPQALEETPLCGALAELAAQVGISLSRPPTLQIGGEERPLPPGVEDRLYRIAQEALTNAIRYADASAIHIELTFEPMAVRLTVRDDGKGFVDDHTLEEGFGLLGMQERAKEVGGRLTLTTRPGHGTTVEAVVPTT